MSKSCHVLHKPLKSVRNTYRATAKSREVQTKTEFKDYPTLTKYEGKFQHYDNRTHFALIRPMSHVTILYIVDIHPESYAEITLALFGCVYPPKYSEMLVHNGQRWLIRLVTLEQAMFFAAHDDMMGVEVKTRGYRYDA